MKPLQNDRLIRALLRQPVDCTPVWIMRQAGRYLPEYRATRERAGDFLSLCKTPELATEVTLQPLARFDLDAAILFSDILTIPDAMGLGLHFVTGEGPRFKHPIQNANDVKALGIPDPEQELAYVPNAVRMIKRELKQRLPLIGFAGSPWTMATYMVEGGPSKNFSKINAMRYSEPMVLHQLLEKLTHATTNYLNAQINAGVDVIMIFDTWGGVLTTSAYHEFSLHYMRVILEKLATTRLHHKIPTIVFTKQGNNWLESIANSGCDAVGIDWTIDIDIARQRIGQHVALQGNLDPSTLLGPIERIRDEVGLILGKFGYGEGHVFNLGHGIFPNICPEKVAELVNSVHSLSKSYHQRAGDCDNKEQI